MIRAERRKSWPIQVALFILATLLPACVFPPLLPAGAAQQTSAALVLEATIPLPDTGGRIDHMAVDLQRQRLFVAELGNGTLDAVDLPARRVVQRIRAL